jgi:hypothetical protein
MVEGAGVHIELITRPGENFKPVDRSHTVRYLAKMKFDDKSAGFKYRMHALASPRQF